jgi:hypothetical protein
MAVLTKVSMPAGSKYGHMNNGSVVVVIGEIPLDETNPTRLNMKTLAKMDRVLGGTVSLKGAVAPGLDPSWLSVDYTGTDENFDIYAWKVTGSGDATLIASAATDTVVYTVIGQVGDRPPSNF